MRFLTFTSLTTFESCESRDNEIVTDILTTPNTLRENSHGCHEIVNTLRDSVVTIVTDRIFTVCFDPNSSSYDKRRKHARVRMGKFGCSFLTLQNAGPIFKIRYA